MHVERVVMAFNHLLDFSPLYFYASFFVMTALEGPITTFVFSAAAATTNVNIYIIFILSFFGDMVSDVILYYIGYTGRDSRAVRKHLSGENTGLLLKVQKMAEEKPLLFYILIKTLPAWAAPGMYYLGYKKENFKRYMLITQTITFIITIMWVSIGYFSIVTLRDFEWTQSWYQIVSMIMVVLIIYVWFTNHRPTRNLLIRLKDRLLSFVTKK